MANDLDLPAIADGQADGQWQTSNDGDAALGNALADIYAVDFSAGNVTLTAAQYRSAFVFKPSAALAAARTLTLPAVKRPFEFHNTDATYTVTLKKTDGGSPEVATTVAVGAGQIFVGYTDGTTSGLFGAVVVAGAAPTGDVVGPAGVTDGNPVVFDGTTGKLIKQRTFTQFTASLIAMVGDSGSGGTKGLVPAPASGDTAAAKFLKADGSWAVPAGSGSVGDGDKGDITVSGSGTVWTVDILSGASAGNILYYDANSPAGWQKLAPGTSGQFLKTLGAAAPAWGDPPYDIPMSFAGTPTAGQLMGKLTAVRDIALPANFSGAVGHVGTNPAATFAIDVQDNGSSIGTISISTGGVFTFTTSSGTAKTITSGHRLEFYAPANSPAEATIANIAATLKGTAI